MKPFTPPTDAELVRGFHEGNSLQFLAAVCRQKHDEIRRRLHARHVATHIGYHFHYRPWEIDELARRLKGWYDDGGGIRELMESTRLNYGQTLELLSRADTRMRTDPDPVRKRNRRKPCPISEDELRKRYEDSGEGMAAIGRTLDASEGLVKRWLQEAGIPLRTRAQAYALSVQLRVASRRK